MSPLSRAIIFLVLVTAVCSPALAAFGPERPISAPVQGGRFGERIPVAMTFHGAEGFVVWNDTRAGSTPVSTYDSRLTSAAYGSRITSRGELIDEGGIRLAATLDVTTAAGVVWVGDAWVTIYQHGSHVFGRRIGADGERLGAAVPLFRGGGEVRVATNGRTFVVTCSAYYSSAVAYIVSADLQDVRKVDTGGTLARSVVSNGESYVVFGTEVWNGIIGWAIPVSASGQTSGRIYSVVTGIEALWTGRNYAGFTAGVQRLDKDALVPVGGAIRLPPDAESVMLRTAGDGALTAFWVQGGSVYGAHVGTAALEGVVRLDAPAPTAVAASPEGFVIASKGMRTALFTRDFARVMETGNGVRSGVAQFKFAAVADGRSDLQVFQEHDGETSRIMIGGPRTGTRILHESSRNQYVPAIASSGSGALVVWIEDVGDLSLGEVISLRVLPDGSAAGPARRIGLTGLNPQALWSPYEVVSPPAVTWTGSMYIVTLWTGIVRLLDDGTVLDPEPRPLRTGGGLHSSLARLGNDVLWVWMTSGTTFQCQMACGTYAAIEATRLTRTGDEIAERYSLSGEGHARPAVASNAGVALVVWWSIHSDEILAVRMSSDGRVVDQKPVSIGYGLRASVAMHRDGFLVSWQLGDRVYAATVSSNMTVGPRHLLASDTSRTQAPVAFTTRSGEAAVAYIRISEENNWVPRLYMRTLDATAGRVRGARH